MKFHKKEIAKTVLALLVPIFVFYLFEWFTHNPFKDMRTGIQIYNIIFFELLMVLFYTVTGRLRIALLLETGIFFYIRSCQLFCIEVPLTTHPAMGFLFHRHGVKRGGQFFLYPDNPGAGSHDRICPACGGDYSVRKE